MIDVRGKAVLVTGGSGGIGCAICQLFSEQSAKVAVHYNRDKDGASTTLDRLKGTGHILVQGNVAEPAEARRVVLETSSKLGRVDILVNNAGVMPLHPLSELDYGAWQKAWQLTIGANLLGPAYLSYCAVEEMLKNGGGKIVNISSRGAFRGEPDAPAYGASKAGLNAMSQSLAKALAPQNIHVYAVAPCFVDTARVSDILNGPQGEEVRHQSPLGRVAKPEEVARTVLFLASAGSEFLTGCIVDVNGASYLRT